MKGIRSGEIFDLLNNKKDRNKNCNLLRHPCLRKTRLDLVYLK